MAEILLARYRAPKLRSPSVQKKSPNKPFCVSVIAVFDLEITGLHKSCLLYWGFGL